MQIVSFKLRRSCTNFVSQSAWQWLERLYLSSSCTSLLKEKLGRCLVRVCVSVANLPAEAALLLLTCKMQYKPKQAAQRHWQSEPLRRHESLTPKEEASILAAYCTVLWVQELCTEVFLPLPVNRVQCKILKRVKVAYSSNFNSKLR